MRYSPPLAAKKAAAFGAVLLLSACATKGDLRNVRDGIRGLAERQDDLLLALQRQASMTQDSLRGTSDQLLQIRGSVSNQLDRIMDELETIRELSGQNQRAMAGIRDQLESASPAGAHGLYACPRSLPRGGATGPGRWRHGYGGGDVQRRGGTVQQGELDGGTGGLRVLRQRVPQRRADAQSAIQSCRHHGPGAPPPGRRARFLADSGAAPPPRPRCPTHSTGPRCSRSSWAIVRRRPASSTAWSTPTRTIRSRPWRRRSSGRSAGSLGQMRCPECDAGGNRVVDTRTSRAGRAVRRRRECSVCGARFTTYEYVEERPVQVPEARRERGGVQQGEAPQQDPHRVR